MSSGAAAGRRTLAPPERRIAEVKRRERIGAYDLIVARDPIGPADPRPGQFYMLSTGEGWGGGLDERPYLPRAFSFATARPLPGGGVDLGFLLEDVGPGTRRLGETAPGDALGIVGPLGVGFEVPAGARPILVGGGIGVAPLLCLEAELVAAGVEPTVLLGFRSAEWAAAGGLFSSSPAIVTDDGSVGARELVTEPLRRALDGGLAGAVVLACGPHPMLEAVGSLCGEQGVPAQLALEAGMACGYGACYGCVVDTRDGYARVCVDGPVFDADELCGAAA